MKKPRRQSPCSNVRGQTTKKRSHLTEQLIVLLEGFKSEESEFCALFTTNFLFLKFPPSLALRSVSTSLASYHCFRCKLFLISLMIWVYKCYSLNKSEYPVCFGRSLLILTPQQRRSCSLMQASPNAEFNVVERRTQTLTSILPGLVDHRLSTAPLIFICLSLILVCPPPRLQIHKFLALSFSLIHHNAPKTMRTNFFLKENTLANSSRFQQEINHVVLNIGQVKDEIDDNFGDHEWAVVIL
jgi:hypothetical protein